MNIQIKEHSETNGTQYFELSTEKKSAFIAFKHADNYVNVICKNAAHKAFRGSGKHFWNGWEEASNSYKSADMKALIEAAKSLSAENITIANFGVA